MYYRGTEAILFVFDLTNRDSFLHLLDWINDVSPFVSRDVVKVIVGNKSDNVEKRQVSKEEIEVTE